MIDYLKNILTRLKKHSQNLDKIELFVDRSWIFIDRNQNNHEYIFERDGKLIMSYNGLVNVGNWRLLATNKLLIDRITDKLLLNNIFLNSDILILQKNGTDDEPFILIDEQIVKNHNYLTYLNELDTKLIDEDDKKNKHPRITRNNKIVGDHLQIGDILSNDNQVFANGTFIHLYSKNKFFEIENNIIKSIYYLQYFKYNNNGNVVKLKFKVKILDNLFEGDELIFEQNDNLKIPIHENFTVTSNEKYSYKIKVNEDYIIYKSYPEIFNLFILGLFIFIFLLVIVILVSSKF